MPACSSFCQSNCKGHHHPVLQALMRVQETKSLDSFKQTLRAYQITGFKLELNIPDPDPEFRFPLLHWAAVLGKVDVLKALVRPPFNVDTKVKSDENESVLHRLLLFWNADTSLDTITDLVHILSDCLSTCNDQRRTPLHVCAMYLTSCSKKELKFWKSVFYLMVDAAGDHAQRQEILDQKDENGDTILHFLSKRCEILELVKYVLLCGAEKGCINNLGQTPLEISWRYALTIYNYLRLSETSSQHSDYESNWEHGRLTRAAVSLSETKDYTEFFQCDNSSDDDEEIELKRKVSESNVSLINELEKLATTSTPHENDDEDFHDITFKRRKKRRRILSDSDSNSDGEIDFVERRQKGINEINKPLKNADGMINIEAQNNGQNKTLEELRHDIQETVKSIKEMVQDIDDEYSDNSGSIESPHDTTDGDDDGMNYDEIEHDGVMNVNLKILTLKEKLLRMTS